MSALSHRIKELRKENKLTQSDLGKILGVGKTTISMYENGNSSPNDEIKLKIAEYFDVSLDYLLCKSDVRNHNTIDSTEKIKSLVKDNGINTLAAHFEGENFTKEDLDDIENFINYVISKKKK